MTKADIAKHIHEKLHIPQKEATAYLEDILEIIKSTLQKGEQIKIAGFGVLQVRQKQDRRGRNPQTGEAITIEARKVLTFKVSNILKEAINK